MTIRRYVILLDEDDPQSKLLIQILEWYAEYGTSLDKRRSEEGISSDNYYVTCSECGWNFTYATRRRAAQGLSAHVRQMHYALYLREFKK